MVRVLTRKLVVCLAVVVTISVFFAGFAIINEMRRRQSLTSNSQNEENPPPQLTLTPALTTYLYEVSGYWTRNSDTDLPEYVSVIRYSVKNLGNAGAENVSIIVRIDEAVYDQHTILLLKPYDTYVDEFTFSLIYDTSKSVWVYASCSKSSDSATLWIEASLPRSFDKNLCKIFITRHEATVVRIKNQILSNKLPIIPDWMALRDWVGNNIKYPLDDVDGDGEPDYDYIKHSRQEYWQLPKETIQLRTGDCEDYAFLLCSLLRANGWSANDAYVVLGKNENGDHHAWVKINLGILGWYNIEPQANGWNTIIGDYLSLSGYQAICYFNDSHFHSIS